MNFLWRELKMIPLSVFPSWECPYAICLQFLYYFICTFTTEFTLCSKYGTRQLSCLIYFSVLYTWCRVSFKRKGCWGTIITLRGRSFLTGNEENPALVLSNVHNRTSARDGPMFGSMGPSMNTSSLVQAVFQARHTVKQNAGSISLNYDTLSFPPARATYIFTL